MYVLETGDERGRTSTHLVVTVPTELAALSLFCAGMLSLGFGARSCGGRKAAVAVSWTLRASVRSSAGVLAAPDALREAGSAAAMSDSGSASADDGSVSATA